MAFLSTWDKVPKAQLLEVFERGHFAGVEEMRTNERLFNRVAPMGVNDIAMACMYNFYEAPKLDIPVTSFDGLEDNTIDPGALHFKVLKSRNLAPSLQQTPFSHCDTWSCRWLQNVSRRLCLRLIRPGADFDLRVHRSRARLISATSHTCSAQQCVSVTCCRQRGPVVPIHNGAVPQRACARRRPLLRVHPLPGAICRTAPHYWCIQTLPCQQRLPVSHVQYMLPSFQTCQEWTQRHNATSSYSAACLLFACAMWRQAPMHARPEVATVTFKSVL